MPSSAWWRSNQRAKQPQDSLGVGRRRAAGESRASGRGQPAAMWWCWPLAAAAAQSGGGFAADRGFAGRARGGRRGIPTAGPGQDLAQDIADRIVATLEDNAPAITRRAGLSDPAIGRIGRAAYHRLGWARPDPGHRARERERTGIASLKVKYKQRVRLLHRDHTRPPGQRAADYTRKQTVANASAS